VASILLFAGRIAMTAHRYPRFLFPILIVIASLMVWTPLAAAAPADVPVISIGLDDYGNVPTGQLTRAKLDVAQAYSDVGVEIAWRETRHLSTGAPPAPMRPTRWTPGLTIIILNSDMVARMAPPSAALGAAPGTLDGPGRIAYVFYSRLPSTPVSEDSQILGLVIAHELGHLLLPYGSHSETGIMRGHWVVRELRRVGLHALGFTPFQAQEIRRRASVAAVCGDEEGPTGLAMRAAR
jgi:hypothetical protein